MNDAAGLLVVLALLYLSERLLWVPRGAAIFIRPFRGEWRRGAPMPFAGNDRGALAWLPTAGVAVVAHAPRLSVSEMGACAFEAEVFGFEGRAPQPLLAATFEEMTDVEVAYTELHVNGATWAVFPSERAARRTAHACREWRELRGQARREAIRRDLDARFDVEAARRAVTSSLSVVAGVRRAGAALWGLMFVVGPLAVWLLGFARAWLGLAVAGLCLHGLVLGLFARAHRRIRPEERGERIMHIVKKILCPPMAIRAADPILAVALEQTHPAAAAMALCPPVDAESFCRGVYRDLAHPMPMPDMSSLAAHVEAEHRHGLLEALAPRLRAAGWRPESWDEPDRALEGERSYCPRCHTHFSAAEGTCADCGGLALRPLPPPSIERSGAP